MARPRSPPPPTATFPRLSLPLSLALPFIQNSVSRLTHFSPEYSSAPVCQLARGPNHRWFISFFLQLGRQLRVQLKPTRRGACTEVVKVLTEPGRFFTCQVPHGQTWILQPRNYARRGTARCPAATRDSSTHASTAFMLLNVIIGTMNYSGSCRIIVCSTSSRQKTRRNLGRCIELIYFRPRVSWMKMWLFVVTLVNLDNVCPIRRWTHLRTVLQSAYPDKALRQAAPTNSRVTLDHRPTSLLTQLLLPFHGFLRCGLTLDSLWRFSSVAFSVLDPRVLAKSLIHLQRNLCFCKFVFSSIRSARESG